MSVSPSNGKRHYLGARARAGVIFFSPPAYSLSYLISIYRCVYALPPLFLPPPPPLPPLALLATGAARHPACKLSRVDERLAPSSDARADQHCLTAARQRAAAGICCWRVACARCTARRGRDSNWPVSRPCVSVACGLAFTSTEHVHTDTHAQTYRGVTEAGSRPGASRAPPPHPPPAPDEHSTRRTIA